MFQVPEQKKRRFKLVRNACQTQVTNSFDMRLNAFKRVKTRLNAKKLLSFKPIAFKLIQNALCV